MNIKLSQKIIKEMCGTVSFKRGDSFYRANKVVIHEYHSDICNATVQGTDLFQVSIEKDSSGNIQTTCSCPTLANYSKSCQHVAAVLIAIYEQKRQETMVTGEKQIPTDEKGLPAEFLSLFQNRVAHSSGHQLHFENREVLDVHFKLIPFAIGQDQHLVGIEVKLGQTHIDDIRGFLNAVNQGIAFSIAPRITYDPKRHCFSNDADALLHILIRIVLDEQVLFDVLPNQSDYKEQSHIVLIPPSAWTSFAKLVNKVSFMSLVMNGRVYEKVEIVEETPPIQFRVEESDSRDFRLMMNGFNQMVVLSGYHSVLCDGKIYPLAMQDMERLTELKQMIASPSKFYIPIPINQLNFFLEKVVPGLKRIGDVRLSPALTNEMKKTPLVAKIYLDRLRNRLLAGLEFHYNHIVIQPLKNQENLQTPIVIRDFEKEAEILQIMEESGFTSTEGGYFMQNEELEYEFLMHAVPKLQKVAQVYTTTAVRNRIVKKSVFPKIRVRVQKERTNWLEFKFEMDGIPHKEIKELLAALELKQKFYRLPNGSLFSLETKEMEEIRAFLQAGPIQDDNYEVTLDRPILDSLKFLDLIQDSPVFAPEESFRQFLDQLLHPGTLDFKVPKSLASIVRDYQRDGYNWMKLLAKYGFGGVLADDMGLGKTLQSIAFIVSELPTIREQKCPVLIVCPSSLTYNWLHEILTFAPELQTIVVDGNLTERNALQQQANEFDVLITSYPLLRRDIEWYKDQLFYTVFFDEAQAFKNPYTQTARTVKKIQANYRFGLSGTPMENSLEELWSIYHVIFPELFKGLEEYRHLPRKAIARRVRPFLLRRVKEDVLGELPDKQEFLEVSELLPEQKKLYAAFLAKLREETLKHLDKDTFRKNRIRILAGLTRLRQICCHPALFVVDYKGKSAKFEQLLQVLEESRLSGRRVLIFSQFTKMLELIGREMTNDGRSYFYLDGQTPPEERVELCNRFNNGEQDLFLISLKAGGTGLNLTGADTVILYDLWWNPAVEEQAADRAHRMGQKNEVKVIKLIARGTIEEKINALQEKKRNLIAEIVDSDEKTLNALTEADIREILMI